MEILWQQQIDFYPDRIVVINEDLVDPESLADLWHTTVNNQRKVLFPFRLEINLVQGLDEVFPEDEVEAFLHVKYSKGRRKRTTIQGALMFIGWDPRQILYDPVCSLIEKLDYNPAIIATNYSFYHEYLGLKLPCWDCYHLV